MAANYRTVYYARMSIAEPVRRSVASVVTPADIRSDERDRMFAIMNEHFVGVERDVFEHDLSEKDWVIRVDDHQGALQGFTTLKLLSHVDGDTTTYGFFSGDTVLSSDFMSDSSWIGVWARHVFAVAAEKPESRFFWILLTATHRTYRILPAAYLRFAPDPDHPDDTELRHWINTFVPKKFPNEFDPARGVVQLAHPIPYRHTDNVAADADEHNRHSRYFREVNPGYLRGDFLCCATEIRPDNVTALGRRILKG